MNILKSISVICFLLLASSCEKSVDISLQDIPNQLVLYSFIFPDSTFKVHYSKSEDILSVNDYQAPNQSSFRLWINNLPQVRVDFPTDSVWSEWDYDFEPGDSIRITCFEEDGDTIESQTIIPFDVEVLAFDTLRAVIENGGIESVNLGCRIKFKDPSIDRNYYQLYVYRESWGFLNGKNFYDHRAIDYEKEDPVFFQSNQGGSAILQNLDYQGLFNDQLFNNEIKVLQFNIEEADFEIAPNENKVRIRVCLYHHTYDYYNYFRTKILSEGYEGYPVFEPIQIHKNIKGGLGVFTGMSFDCDSLVFERDVLE